MTETDRPNERFDIATFLIILFVLIEILLHLFRIYLFHIFSHVIVIPLKIINLDVDVNAVIYNKCFFFIPQSFLKECKS